MSTILAILSNF